MYFWTITAIGEGTYTVKASSFGEACKKVGLNYAKSKVLRVANA